MNKFKFVPQDGFRDASAYPNPTSEAETRSQMQSIPDQLKDYINNEILDGTDSDAHINVSNVPLATSTTPGLMSSADKAKVDSPNPSTMPYHNSSMEATNVKTALDELCDDVNLIEEDLPDYIYDVKVDGRTLTKTRDSNLHSSVNIDLSKKLDATDWECGIRYNPGGVYMGNVLDDSVVSPMINIDSDNIFISGEDQTTDQSWEMVTGIRVDGEGEKIELDAPNGVKINGVAIDPTAKQDTLVSGTNIKTINGESVLGSGDITTSDFSNIQALYEPPIRRLNVTYNGETFGIPSFNDTTIKPYLLPVATTSRRGAVIVDSAMSDSSTNPVQNSTVKAYIDAHGGGEANVIESISVNGTALTPVNKGVNIPIAQYTINGTGYDILDIQQATVNSVEGFYIHYDDGSINGAFVFVPNMVGMTYASGQIIATAQTNASELVNARNPSATPLMDGTASVGSGSRFAYEDHVHPTDTSRQATLVSGTNIKTINGTSILGSGDLPVSGGTTDYTALTNKPAINSVTLTGNKTAGDLGLQNAIEVVTKTASDTTNTLETDKFYVFPTMATLSVTVTGTGMYTFRFTSGSTATTLTVTGATMPDSFTVEASKVYEVNIYQGYGVVSSWTVS